jgi:hypothetical protein
MKNGKTDSRERSRFIQIVESLSRDLSLDPSSFFENFGVFSRYSLT